MFLKQIDISNFRGIEQLSLSLDDLCVLIGENNAGKSSVLDAVRLCLTQPLTRRGSVFEEYDHHLADKNADPASAEPIELTLTFAEGEKGEWPDEISQLLRGAEQVDDEGLRSVTLRVRSQFDPVTKGYETEHSFLDLSGEPLVGARNTRQLPNLQRIVPTFYLASLRDAAREFRARSPFWGPFVKALELDEEARIELEAALQELNRKVLDQHTAFESVKNRLKETAELLPLGEDDPVSIDAVPSKVFDILSRTQVSLASRTGAHIPIVRHGNGTQSLAVICLFDAFLQSRLADEYDEHATPLLALEEPEAHLHPSAIKAVGEMLNKISGQKLMSTHSGDLLAGVPLVKIRRLRRKGGKIVVHKLDEGVLTPDEISKLDYHIRSTRGSLLFSRCWLLVEGETEAPLVLECARAMGYDLYADGVSCVEFAQIGVEKFIKLADQLGIEWFVLADNDQEGAKYAKSARNQLGSRNEADHIRQLDHGAMEKFLCMEGFGDVYESTIAPQKESSITAAKDTPEYWDQVINAQQKGIKTRNSLEVAQQIADGGGRAVPSLLKQVIKRVRALARSAG